MIDLTLQLLLVVLLLLTIAWCVLVHSRLRGLRADRGELQGFVAALVEATARAEETVLHLREASRAIETSAGERERQARQQAETLARLTENAGRAAKWLDSAVEQGATRLAERRTHGPRGASASADLLIEERGDPLRQSPAADAVATGDVHEQERAALHALQDSQSIAEPLVDDPRIAARGASLDRSLHRPAAASGASGGEVSDTRRAGQLDGLLNRELRDALQSLR